MRMMMTKLAASCMLIASVLAISALIVASADWKAEDVADFLKAMEEVKESKKDTKNTKNDSTDAKNSKDAKDLTTEDSKASIPSADSCKQRKTALCGGTFNTKKDPYRSDQVSINNPVVYNFTTSNENERWDLVKLAVQVNPKKGHRMKFPISVTVHARGAVMSVVVPYGPDNSYNRREVLLCPAPDTKIATKGPQYDWEYTSAIASVTTESLEAIAVNTSLTSMRMTSNFILRVDGKPANSTPKAFEPAVHRVDIDENTAAVRIDAVGKDDMCAVLAIQSLNTCPFITLSDYERAYRRLTFTRQASMVVRRRELESFYVVVFPLPDDEACGVPGEPVHGRPNQKKSVVIGVSTASSGFFHYALPIIVTLVFYGAFFIAVAPVAFVKALTAGRSAASQRDNQQPLSIRGDDDPMMNASASRCVTPKPTGHQQRQGEPETGHLISIVSPSTSLVNEEGEDPFAGLEKHQETGRGGGDVDAKKTSTDEQDVLFKPLSAATVETEHDGDDDDAHKAESGETIPRDNRVTLREEMQSPHPSDVSCVLTRGDGNAAVARLELDTPTRSYAWIQTILCGFLLLVVIQQTAWVYPKFAHGADMDVCYFNSRCGAPLGSIVAFNHTISNIGYVLLGILALLLLRKRFNDHKKELSQKGAGYVHSFGLPTHFGMMTALAIGITSQGILSAVYHQCPNSSSIQSELVNVYLTALLALLKLYGSRHEPTEAHVAYGVAFVFWTLATISSVTSFQSLWWMSFCIVELIMMPLLSLQVYYHGHVAYSMASLKVAKQSIERVLWAELKRGNWKPLFGHRLTALLVVNILNIITSVIVAASSTMTMSEYIISSMIGNLILYFVYYLGNKMSAKETIEKMTWFYLAAALLFWIAALKFFFSSTIDWKLTAAESRALNQDCALFGFYDSHDMWHLLSSVALFFSFMSLLTLDDDLKGKRRHQIAVF